MSMALSSSLRALARPILPFDSSSARLRLSGVAAPVAHARRRPWRRGAGVVALPSDAEWLERLLEKKKLLYTHSLPCIETWLRSIEFTQTREDHAVWIAEMPLWHARLSLDVTDLHISCRDKPAVINSSIIIIEANCTITKKDKYMIKLRPDLTKRSFRICKENKR